MERSEVGCLCARCAKQVPPGETLIPEHIHSTISGVDADAWLVDGFGQAHAVSARSVIGRKPAGPPGLISVLTPSVSGNHAELKHVDGAWTVKDLGSRNGTHVDGVKIQARTTMVARTVVRIGDVPMWFLTEVADDPVRPVTMDTQELRDVLINYQLTTIDGVELRLTGNAEGGSLLQRRETGWGGGRNLSQLEYQLLRTLCARAIAEANSEEAARGCVSTKQLVTLLDFKAKYANEENVRQVVRRLRVAFSEIGIRDLVDALPGRGYFMSCQVTVGGK